jgi:3-oxoacyl-[acyl-carrier-protein] synthase II
MCHILSGITFSRLEDRDGMKNHRRVVLTGLGVVAPNGIGKQAFWESLIAGKSGVDWITAFDPTPYPCKVAAEVKDFRPQDFMSKRHSKDLWRFTQFAVAAARMAADDAKIDETSYSDRVGACFGTCLNGFEKIEQSYAIVQTAGYQGLDPFTCIHYSTHAPVSYVSIALGITGPSITLASGCSTGLDVIKWAYDQIRDGTVSAVIAGSTEAPLTPLAFSTFCAVGVLAKAQHDATHASRPYDLTRDGMVLGEAAGAVVIESLEHAEDRGAPIYAEVIGYGMSSEARHMRKVDLTGAALSRAIHNALNSSGVSMHAIDYINSHGNSMPDYDLSETNAFKKVFGSRAYSIPVSSIKSMIGQPIAASGTLQAISTALTLTTGILPPTTNLTTPDPLCDLDYVPNRSRVSRVQTAMVNAHSVGGTHSVLLLAQPGIH